jgi:hypothetical protein
MSRSRLVIRKLERGAIRGSASEADLRATFREALMRLTIPISQMKNVARLGLLVLALAIVGVAQSSQEPLAINRTIASSNRTAGGPHSVTLTWNASLPASTASRDAISGYNVYRSVTLPVAIVEANRINCAFVTITSCVDNSVAAGQTYYYVATALVVAASGSAKESAASQPALKVTVPIP